MTKHLRGRRGATGKQGLRGKSGAKGATGARGFTGARGPAGPAVSKVQILAAVSDQFAAVNQRLQTQLARIAQLQQQLDQQQRDIVETRADVARIRVAIETVIKTTS